MQTLITDDITHPSVSVLKVSATSRGWLDQNKARDLLNDWAFKYNTPKLGSVGLTTALKRAMKELAKGQDRELKVTGRKSTAVYTLIALDLDKVDRETHDGSGVGTAEISCRIKIDPDAPEGSEKYMVKIDPMEHPAAELIREKFNHFCGLISPTYDIKPWLFQTTLPSMGAIRSTDGQGNYWIQANEENRQALTDLRETLSKLNGTGKMKLIVEGHSPNSQNAIDLIADGIIEETERVCGSIEKLLDENREGKKNLGSRALLTQANRLSSLHEKLNGLQESVNMAGVDFSTSILEVEKKLGEASLHLE